MRRLAALPPLLAAALLAGCQGGPAERGEDAAAASAAPAPALGATARRPARRYYMSHVEGRCEVYFADGDQLSPPARFPCPLDLFQGERIRIAGKTCTRESSDPERQIPVVCPDPLTNLEKRERAKGP
jgi:hypothetical protein